MAITPVESPTQAYDAGAPRRLGVWRALGRKLDARDPNLAREAASLLTSQLFFAPLLAEMRRLPFGREFGHGGRMEDAFGEQLDMQIADTVARSDRGLTAQLAKELIRKQPSLSLAMQQVSQPAEAQDRAAGTGGGK
jgi:hypothetical protein